MSLRRAARAARAARAGGQVERWRRLRNDELHNLFCSQHVMRIMKATDDDMETGHSTFIGDMKIHRKSNPRPSHNPDTNRHKKTYS